MLSEEDLISEGKSDSESSGDDYDVILFIYVNKCSLIGIIAERAWNYDE